jgi:hypothetical protein
MGPFHAMQGVFYNWVRVNAAVKATPAQASGLTEYRMTVKDMLHFDMWEEAKAA